MTFLLFLIFFYFIRKKYLIIHIFFIKNIPINYPSLSKIIQKLSNWSKKNQKFLKKIRKNRIFSLFSLWSQRRFYKNLHYHLSCKMWKKCLKKNVKKKRFSFLQTFFLKSFLDIYLCPISKIKKEFQKVTCFPFFPFFFSLKIAIYPPKINILYFLHCFHIFGGTFDNLYFYFLICFILINFLYFLSYVKHKYLIWVIFFIKNIPINYPSLSKIIQKLSKRSKKNPKNLEKIRFFHFFSYGVSTIFIQYIITIWRKKNEIKCLEKIV